MVGPTYRSSIAQKFARGAALKCPRCGSGGLLVSWMRMQPQCPRCGLRLERGESDFWLGAYAMNLFFAESFAAVVALIVLWATWPASLPATIVGGALAIAAPIAFYPFSRTLWLAWDLSFRPSEPGDRS